MKKTPHSGVFSYVCLFFIPLSGGVSLLYKDLSRGND